MHIRSLISEASSTFMIYFSHNSKKQ